MRNTTITQRAWIAVVGLAAAGLAASALGPSLTHAGEAPPVEVIRDHAYVEGGAADQRLGWPLGRGHL